MSELIEKLRAHGEHAVSYSFHKSRELSRDAAYEIVRLQARVERLEGAVQHNLDCVHAREARVEALEGVRQAAQVFLDAHDTGDDATTELELLDQSLADSEQEDK